MLVCEGRDANNGLRDGKCSKDYEVDHRLLAACGSRPQLPCGPPTRLHMRTFMALLDLASLLAERDAGNLTIVLPERRLRKRQTCPGTGNRLIPPGIHRQSLAFVSPVHQGDLCYVGHQVAGNRA